ncbi:MAG: transglutaminase family protein [Nakamurella sp.]
MSDLWRLRIQHRTVHTYSTPVTGSYNEIRMQPVDTAGQAVLATSVELHPNEGSMTFYDYFGTQVTSFDLHRPHETLTINVTTTVETSTPQRAKGIQLDWVRLRQPETTEDLSEFLAATPLTTLTDDLRAEADALVRDVPAATAEQICSWVNRQLNYMTGTTHVHSSAAEAWEARSGVCQDFSHLSIAMMRYLGIPARYVSGYLHPRTDPEIGEPVRGESHAWVEYFVGHWRSWDPTNDKPPGPGHVFTGRGRDYADVPPMRGLFAGGVSSEVSAEVIITRLR